MAWELSHVDGLQVGDDYLELGGDHGLDGVNGVGELGQGLGLVLPWTQTEKPGVHNRLAGRTHENSAAANLLPVQIGMCQREQ